MQIYAERAAFCKQRPTISQCQTHARNPIQLKRLNAAFEKQEHTIRARRRALAHEKNAVRNTLTQLLTNDVKAVAPVRRSALEQSLRPSDSRPRVYVYNISRIFNDINLTRAQILAYDSLLRNDALQHLPWGSKLQHMRLGVREMMYADGWLHEHLVARTGAGITSDARAADFFWLPVWGYALCTTLERLSTKDFTGHMMQTMYEPCVAMGRVHEWMFRQPTWQRSHGADHFYIMNYKDRLSHYGRHANPNLRIRNSSLRLIENAIFITTEDRHAKPHLRIGCTSLVVPYYADANKWSGGGRSLTQLQEGKRTLLGFVGNSKGKSCHLEKWACPPRKASGSANFGPDTAGTLRSRIAASISRSNGSVLDMQGLSPANVGFSDAEALLQSVFCPCPLGDVYSTKRLFTVIQALCIPIIVSDRLRLPFERRLNWTSFSLKVPERDILSQRVDIVAYAQSVPATRILELQRALWDVQPLLTFSPGDDSSPADATSMMLSELHNAKSCVRVVLVERLSSAGCMHGVSFGLTSTVVNQQMLMWVAMDCSGVFTVSAHGRVCPEEMCERVTCLHRKPFLCKLSAKSVAWARAQTCTSFAQVDMRLPAVGANICP